MIPGVNRYPSTPILKTRRIHWTTQTSMTPTWKIPSLAIHKVSLLQNSNHSQDSDEKPNSGKSIDHKSGQTLGYKPEMTKPEIRQQTLEGFGQNFTGNSHKEPNFDFGTMPPGQKQLSPSKSRLGNANNGPATLGVGNNSGNMAKSPRSDRSGNKGFLSGKSENSPGKNLGLLSQSGSGLVDLDKLDCDLDTSGFGLGGMGEARARLILGKVEYLKKEKGILEEVINRQVQVDSSELGDWLVLQFLENRKYFELEKKQFADDCEAKLLELEQRESSLSQDEATLKAHLDDATKRDAELTEKIERVTDVKNFQLICSDFDANLTQNNYLTQENHRLQLQHSTILPQLQTSQTSLRALQTIFSHFTTHHKHSLISLHSALTTQTTQISQKYQIHLQTHKNAQQSLQKSITSTKQDAREI